MGGTGISLVGTWMQVAAQGYVVSTLTDKASVLGWINLALLEIVLLTVGEAASSSWFVSGWLAGAGSRRFVQAAGRAQHRFVHQTRVASTATCRRRCGIAFHPGDGVFDGDSHSG